MAKNRKSFADDIDTAGNRRVAEAIIRGRQPVDTPPKPRDNPTDKTSVGKLRVKPTGKTSVVKLRDNPTGKTSVEKIRDNPTGKTPVEKSPDKSTGNRRVIKTREIRSRRVELIVTPSLYNRLQSEATEAEESVNETINQIIEIYFAEKGG